MTKRFVSYVWLLIIGWQIALLPEAPRTSGPLRVVATAAAANKRMLGEGRNLFRRTRLPGFSKKGRAPTPVQRRSFLSRTHNPSQDAQRDGAFCLFELSHECHQR